MILLLLGILLLIFFLILILILLLLRCLQPTTEEKSGVSKKSGVRSNHCLVTGVGSFFSTGVRKKDLPFFPIERTSPTDDPPSLDRLAKPGLANSHHFPTRFNTARLMVSTPVRMLGLGTGKYWSECSDGSGLPPSLRLAATCSGGIVPRKYRKIGVLSRA